MIKKIDTFIQKNDIPESEGYQFYDLTVNSSLGVEIIRIGHSIKFKNKKNYTAKNI